MRKLILAVAALAVIGLGPATGPLASPLAAQITTVDPNDSIDADLDSDLPPPPPPPSYPADTTVPPAPADQVVTYQYPLSTPPAVPPADSNAPADTTYQKDDLIGAAEGVFGKGAEGLGRMIEDILQKQGQPNGYIVGREAAGAFVVGLRYGSGTLFHKVEGERDVYWTGPSIGFDTGGNASKSFILVYNLYNTQDLFKRYPAGEGAAYLVGGFTASYLRRDDVVLIPMRLGVGLRLGANIGYMKFSEKRRWLPF